MPIAPCTPSTSSPALANLWGLRAQQQLSSSQLCRGGCARFNRFTHSHVNFPGYSYLCNRLHEPLKSTPGSPPLPPFTCLSAPSAPFSSQEPEHWSGPPTSASVRQLATMSSKELSGRMRKQSSTSGTSHTLAGGAASRCP